MTDLSTNPIYKRMIQGSRGPPLRVCLLMALGIAVCGNALWPITIGIPSLAGEVVILFLMVILQGIAVLQPLLIIIAMVDAARLASHYITGEEFGLIRISGLGEQDIVRGLEGGVRYRFRFRLWLGLGVLTNVSIPLLIAHFYSNSLVNPRVLTILFLTTSLLAYYFVLWPLCLTAGIWLALITRRFAFGWSIALGVAMAVIYAILAIVLVWATARNTGMRGPYYACASYALLTLVLPYIFLRALRDDCIVQVHRME